MVIDFHTHIFPDKIAARTISYLSEKGGIPPYSDGSVNGLLGEMEAGGVDLAVALPVVTNPAQFDSVNRFAAEVNTRFENEARRLISFAGIHPKCEEIEEKMRQIKASGFLGVKIHPDYQETNFNDEGYLRILAAAKELDLIVVTHAGVDAGYRGCPVRCTPALAAEVIDRVRHPKLVLAHYGANELFEEVYAALCGKDVYFDTAYILHTVGKETFEKILRRHGADRILFATDSPWSSMKTDREILQAFGLDQKTERMILCDNAKRLLGL